MKAISQKSVIFYLFFIGFPLLTSAQEIKADKSIKLAIEQSQQGQLDSSIENCNRALIFYPGSARGYYVRGSAYQLKANYDQAIIDYNKAIELDSVYLDAYFNRGNAYKIKANYDQAIIDYNKVIKMAPTYVDAYNNRGSVYKAIGSYDQAIIDYNKAIQLDPKYAIAYYNRANAYDEKGNNDKAIIDCNKAIELDPKYVNAYVIRAHAYLNKGNYEQAVIDYTNALRIAPLNEYALLNILVPLIRLNRFGEANDYYQKYRTNQVKGFIEGTGWEYYKYYLNAATIYLKDDDYPRALVELETGETAYNINTLKNNINKESKTSYANFLALKGYTLFKLNKLQEALVAYSQALVIKPNQPEVSKAIRNIVEIQDTSVKRTIEPRNNQASSQHSFFDDSNTPPKFFAILIAEENYKDQSIKRLYQPVNDALKLKQVLETYYSFSSSNIDTIFNRRKEDILSAIANRCNTLKETDNLLIFYSGHGTFKKNPRGENRGFLIPSSAENANIFTYINSDDITLALGLGNVKHILIIVDACFGGALFRDLPSDAPRDIKNIYKDPSRRIMSSGNLEPVPDKSVFLYYVIKRLKENKEEYLTGEGLFHSLIKAVQNGSDNVPQYNSIKNSGDEGGDFVFIKNQATNEISNR
ncbi:tetratricopeptide repeat protein [Mucilaginibacter angelicae]|uniref:Tetratricopeptide repeat protein n=1 Tax=Mucilaginibacter angelicae TaxID=869718 RepID=A0ABV6L6N5_9SPHI